ncbi:MAG: hypothetical protein FD143_1663 [Ignavibacteria bacterium]|nr:MAG: hypothetical protein FD143_1663 [Ignavibacteria bacterium]KAF0161708.1 MAG: hypothetical protein FD188_513 [Ignavibacteria bacterium]
MVLKKINLMIISALTEDIDHCNPLQWLKFAEYVYFYFLKVMCQNTSYAAKKIVTQFYFLNSDNLSIFLQTQYSVMILLCNYKKLVLAQIWWHTVKNNYRKDIIKIKL